MIISIMKINSVNLQSKNIQRLTMTQWVNLKVEEEHQKEERRTEVEVEKVVDIMIITINHMEEINPEEEHQVVDSADENGGKGREAGISWIQMKLILVL